MIQAVFVVDTVINVAMESGMQEVPDSWYDVVPEVAQEINDRSKVGDFLALIGRKSEEEQTLMKVFRKYFHRGPFHLQNFTLSQLPTRRFPTEEELTRHAYFWLSDNSRFWFYKEGVTSYSFPALILTDTGR